MKYLAILFIAGMLLLAGCAQNNQAGSPAPNGAQSSAAQNSGSAADTAKTPSAPATPAQIQKNETKVENLATANTNPVVVIETSKGVIKAEIYQNDAPITAGNFLKLVNRGFYNGLTFHRVVPNFVVQGGDPKGDGSGGAESKIPLEVKPNLKHVYGTLAMARSSDPDSASSQFYIVKGEAAFLDGQYAVFGKVIDGMPVVEKIVVGDKMTKVSVQN